MSGKKEAKVMLLHPPEGMSKRTAHILASRAVFDCACAAARTSRKIGLLSLARPAKWTRRRLSVITDARTRQNLIVCEDLPSPLETWLSDNQLSELWIDDFQSLSLALQESAELKADSDATALELIQSSILGSSIDVFIVFHRGRLYANLLYVAGKIDSFGPVERPKTLETDDSEEEIRELYGLALAEMRRRSGLSPAEVSKRSDIATYTIRAWEEGRASPRFNNLIRYLEALGGRLSTLENIAGKIARSKNTRRTGVPPHG